MSRSNLPAPLTPLIGRERDLDAIQQLFQRNGVRLVTLVGPAGVGKTRLGLEIAGSLERDFTDGSVFVPSRLSVIPTSFCLPLLNIWTDHLPLKH